MPDLYVDAKAAVAAWGNALTTSLVGPGNPLRLGFHFQRQRSPDGYAYALLASVGGDSRLGFGSRARVSASIFGSTTLDVDAAATAYLNALAALERGNTPMPGGSAVCLMVGDITGPIEVPGDEPQRLVDADFYLVSA